MTEKVKAALKVGDPFRTSFPHPNIFYLQASKKLDEKAKLDVLELLGQLEGELQAKDIAIATLKVVKYFVVVYVSNICHDLSFS